MHSVRTKILLAAAVLTLLFGAWQLFRSDGLITLDFHEAPVSKVIASFERQGRIRLATNVPPETPVTIQVKRAPLMEALETLAVRLDGDWRVVYAGAPTKAQAQAVVEGVATDKRSDQWATAWFPAMGLLEDEAVVDPRTLTVKPEADAKNDLQSALRQIAMKSGIMTAVPQDWNPTAKMPAKSATAASLVKQLIQSSGGQFQESFLIIVRSGREWVADRGNPPPPQGMPGERPPGDGRSRSGREGMNPEWLAQRTEAAIARLPTDQQQAARTDYDTMKKFWEEVRALPEDQRRPKIAEFMSRPDIQEKMEQRMAARDARRSPEQRERRMKNYIERKKQIKGAPPKA